MSRLRLLFSAIVALTCTAPASAGDTACETCPGQPFPAEHSRAEERPLHIEIESGLQFSRLALVGQKGGAAELDPRTGQKRMVDMIDLGGMSYQARATVTGEPLRPVRIELPARVALRSPGGGEAELTDFVTDVPAVAVLDENGTLTFNIGARISSPGATGGDFRGRINIRVDYF